MYLLTACQNQATDMLVKWVVTEDHSTTYYGHITPPQQWVWEQHVMFCSCLPYFVINRVVTDYFQRGYFLQNLGLWKPEGESDLYYIFIWFNSKTCFWDMVESYQESNPCYKISTKLLAYFTKLWMPISGVQKCWIISGLMLMPPLDQSALSFRTILETNIWNKNWLMALCTYVQAISCSIPA